MKVRTLWADFVDLIFPRCCEACDQALVGAEQVICTSCRIDLPRVADNSLLYSLKNRLASHYEVKEVWSYLIFSKKGYVQNLRYRSGKPRSFSGGRARAASASIRDVSDIHAARENI